MVLGFSPHPPVSVYGTGTSSKANKLFSSVQGLQLLYSNFDPLTAFLLQGHARPTAWFGYLSASLIGDDSGGY